MPYQIGREDKRTFICAKDDKGKLAGLLEVIATPASPQADTLAAKVAENFIAILNGVSAYSTIEGAMLYAGTTPGPDYVIRIGTGRTLAETSIVLHTELKAPADQLRALQARIEAAGGIESIAGRFKVTLLRPRRALPGPAGP